MGRVYASKVYLSIEKAFPEVEGSCAETSSGPRGNTFIKDIIQIPPPNVNKKTVLHANTPRPYGRGAFLWAYMRQHLPKKPHSSFSREAQSKLQNIMLYLLCIFPLQGQRHCNRFVTLLQM